MKLPTIAFIDPGKTGGIVIFNGKKYFQYRMPVTDGRVNITDLLNTFYSDKHFIDGAVIEKPFLPKFQAGSLTTGINYGVILAALDYEGVVFKEIRSQDWQKILDRKSLGREEQKKTSILTAQEELKKYGQSLITLTKSGKKPHDGVADAVCMCKAYYC